MVLRGTELMAWPRTRHVARFCGGALSQRLRGGCEHQRKFTLSGAADDHDAAYESGGDGGTDGNIHGGGERHGTAKLPVAEERSEHRGRDFFELHDPGNDDCGQRGNLRRGGEQLYRERDEQPSNADSKRGSPSADDHDSAPESGGHGGTSEDLHGSGERHATAKLPVTEERSEHRGRDFF